MAFKTVQERRNYFWNTLAGLLNAAEAVVMSMIVTRVTGVEDAGILSLAFAVGNLMMTIGKFGMRNYQVSDVTNSYSFADYLKSRFVTCGLMVIVSVGFLVYCLAVDKYSTTKALCVLMICLIYVIEAIEDVFGGQFQIRGRLDLYGKAFCARWLMILLVFAIVLCLSKTMSVALTLALLASFIVALTVQSLYHHKYREILSAESSVNHKSIRALLRDCTPLFLSVFLSFYLINSPKYAIDQIGDEIMQACYGFISMPIFVISLVSSFLYQPMMVEFADYWNTGNTKALYKKLKSLCLTIMLISVLCEIGAFFVGIPLLSLVYNVDLSAYRTELLVLLGAGFFLALIELFGAMLTIMRLQRIILSGYFLISCFALVSLSMVGVHYGTMGVTITLFLSLFILAVSFYFSFLRKTHAVRVPPASTN